MNGVVRNILDRCGGGMLFGNAALALTYVLLGLFCTHLQVANQIVTVIPFFPEGVGLAIALWGGFAFLPGIFCGQLILALANHAALPLALMIAVGNASTCALGVFLLRKLCLNIRLESFRDFALLLSVSALLCQPLSASIGHLGLWLNGAISPRDIPMSWLYWWESNATAQLLLTPLLLRFLRSPTQLLKSSVRRFAIFMGLTTIIGCLVFLRIPAIASLQSDLKWLFLPLISVAAAIMGLDMALSLTFLVALLFHASLIAGVSSLDLHHLSYSLTQLNILLATCSLCACYVGVINSQLVIAREAATSASEIRTRFLASMSHEIRTPLNGMLGLVQLLQRSGVRGKERRHIEEIGRAGRSLLSLLNNILDLSKLEAGEFHSQATPFLLDDVLEDTASLCLATIQAKNLDFWIGCAPGVPHQCIGDPVRLQQILTNLVGNAAKFTETGSIQILVTTLNEPAGHLRFEIRDTGIGMDELAMRHIFEPYHQGDHSISNRYGGTGLGLTLSRGIALQMGGSLDVASTLGKGSRFILTMPLDAHSHIPSLQGSIAIDLKNDFLREAVELSAKRLGWNINPSDAAAICISDAGGEGQIQIGDAESLQQGAANLAWPFTPQRLQRALQEFIQGSTAFLIPVVRSTLAGQRILLVEDEPVNRLVARQILEQAGAEISEACDGQEALDLLEKQSFHSILMDLHMPIMGGIETTRRIRLSQHDKVNILALTAGSTDEERQECERAGMDGFLTKPFDAEILIQTLAKFRTT